MEKFHSLFQVEVYVVTHFGVAIGVLKINLWLLGGRLWLTALFFYLKIVGKTFNPDIFCPG